MLLVAFLVTLLIAGLTTESCRPFAKEVVFFLLGPIRLLLYIILLPIKALLEWFALLKRLIEEPTMERVFVFIGQTGFLHMMISVMFSLPKYWELFEKSDRGKMLAALWKHMNEYDDIPERRF